MPLPPALAAKLSKRGIIKKDDIDHKETDEKKKEQEEIIAEDYDDTLVHAPYQKSNQDTFDRFQGWSACPNKWNVYHECTPDCVKHWTETRPIDPAYNKKRQRMLLKYPLPSHWKELLEPGVGRYYYWNKDTNLVSWLPPGHPKCQVSRAATELRQAMVLEREKRLAEEDNAESDATNSDGEEYKNRRTNKRDHSSDSSDDSEQEERPSKRISRKPERRERSRHADRSRGDRNRSRKGPQEDALDPMDPAAYSECPRGTWSTGLAAGNEAKTGVDTTASGPLFQMRPYPSPGSVLRANAAAANIGPKKG